MAESIRKCRLHAVNDDIMTRIEYPPLGHDWFTNFLGRHPHLKTIVGQTIESSRIQGTLPNVLKKWFDAFYEEVETDPEVLLENVYNMDESGFSIGTIKAGCVIVNTSIHSKLQAQPGRQEQPLDIGIFSPLKEYMTQEIDPLVRNNVPQFQKVK